MSRRIVHFDADAFAVAVERRRDVALARRPVVVASEAGGRGLVVCASYEARAHGVHAGQLLADARRLMPAGGGREWVFLAPDPAEYRRVSHLLGSFLAAVAPVAELSTLDDVVLDVSGCEALFGGDLEAWARRVAARSLAELGIPLSAGVASNKLVAQVACRQAKPGGVVQAGCGMEAAFLDAVPLGILPGLRRRALERMAHYGITRAGDILRVPRDMLAMLMGSREAAELCRLAMGIDHEAVGGARSAGVPTAALAPVIVSHVFEEDTRHPDLLRAAVTLLAGRFAWELARRSLLCEAAELIVIHIDGAPRARMLSLHGPTDEEDGLAHAARAGLGAAVRRRVRVRRLDLVSSACVRAGDERQPDLFAQASLRPGGRQGDLALAVERVRARHGFGGLVTASALRALRPGGARG